MEEMQLLITDFDGTLIDTFKANFLSYQKVFNEMGLKLTYDEYKVSFGLRFDNFMERSGIVNLEQKMLIKERKKLVYPEFFNHLKINAPLLQFLQAFRRNGGLIAIGSTADKSNLFNVVEYLGLKDSFNCIMAGEDVVNAKPDPEIYLSIMKKLNISPLNTLIFEDSELGLKAAEDSGAKYIRIKPVFFDNLAFNKVLR